MRYLQKISEMRSQVLEARGGRERIGFVPTMGALHEGHRSLMRAARAACGQVAVSIFVNPTQFGPNEDFERYPRPIEADLAVCEQEGVDAVFCPAVAEMYPSSSGTSVRVPASLGEVLCGRHRPGHFEGVATVVTKLFNIVQPDVAYFGQKDFQQTVVLKHMVRDLCWSIELAVCPTVREPDGLAMSSRNAYLPPEQRTQARSLHSAMMEAQQRIASGERDVAQLVRLMREHIESAGPCRIDYVEMVDPDDLTPQAQVDGQCVIVMAVRIGECRLIDNLLVDAGQAMR